MNERQQRTKCSKFGDLLRQFRVAAGLSQEALAERALVSVEAVSALERGISLSPQRETLALLVEALELNEDQQRAVELSIIRRSAPRVTTRRTVSKTNLPAVAGTLYGRERETIEAKEALETSRVVSLIGAGGVGKTRLALQIASESSSRFRDGIWFVDLACVRDPLLVPSAVATALGVSESTERPLASSIVEMLHEKSILLLIDNCEHLRDAVATVVASIIAGDRRVRVLATSRRPLGIAGELIYRVASLGIAAATALFADRAKRSGSEFEITEETAEVVGRVCRRLDGIPLAIELAAARSTVVSPQQLEMLLDERFRLLTSNDALVLPRQQTMRATIDWSYELLDRHEQLLFCRLTVFVGGFSLEAAGAVCSDETLDTWRVLELLASLVEKSLVISEMAGTAQRFHLLESMRDYTLEKLSGDELRRVTRRHAEYYTGVAQSAQNAFALHSTMAWASLFDPDLQNFRSALNWALACGNAEELGVLLLTRLQEFWILQGLTIEALRYTRRAREILEQLSLPLRAALWLTLARMQHEHRMAPQEMLDAAARACALYEELEEPRELALALRERGVAHVQLGAFGEAQDDLQRSLDLYRDLNDVRMMVRTLGNLGRLRQMEGALEEARAIMLEVIQLSTDIGDDRSAIVMSVTLAEVEFSLGVPQAAADRATENLTNHFILNKSSFLRAGQESNLAAYLFALGREEEARSMALLSMREADYDYVAVPMQHLAAIMAPSDPQRAATLLGFVEGVFAKTSFSRENTELYTLDRLMHALQQRLDESEIFRYREIGATLTQDQALRLARRRKPVTASTQL